MHSITEAPVQNFNTTSHSALMFKNKSTIVILGDSTSWDACSDFISESRRLFKLL